jgi:enterochelin esterase-like enzyme
VKRFSLRALLYWLGPTAGVGTLAGQTRPLPSASAITIDTIHGLDSGSLAAVPAIRVFLPPGYHDTNARYPVLYANDGQDMESVGLIRTLDSLVRQRIIQPIIVVAVDAGPDRLQNYGTAGQPNAAGLGARAADYERFLVRELVPLIARRYRATRDRAAIMGWSLGGLSAFDLAWRNSEIFGAVGVFSGSFWWRTDDSSVAARQNSRILHRRVRETPRAPDLRVWLEAGIHDEQDDRDGNGVIDAIQDTRELMDEMGRKGMRGRGQVHYLEMDGGHDPATWGKALPMFLAWVYAS